MDSALDRFRYFSEKTARCRAILARHSSLWWQVRIFQARVLLFAGMGMLSLPALMFMPKMLQPMQERLQKFREERERLAAEGRRLKSDMDLVLKQQ